MTHIVCLSITLNRFAYILDAVPQNILTWALLSHRPILPIFFHHLKYITNISPKGSNWSLSHRLILPQFLHRLKCITNISPNGPYCLFIYNPKSLFLHLRCSAAKHFDLSFIISPPHPSLISSSFKVYN